jgi:SAP domain
VNHSLSGTTNANTTTSLTTKTSDQLAGGREDGHDGGSKNLNASHVKSLKVSELRQALEARGLDKNGLKKDLQDRLLAIVERELSVEQRKPESAMTATLMEQQPAIKTTETMAERTRNDPHGTVTSKTIKVGKVTMDEGQTKEVGQLASDGSKIYLASQNKQSAAVKVTSVASASVVGGKTADNTIHALKVKSPPKVSEETTANNRNIDVEMDNAAALDKEGDEAAIEPAPSSDSCATVKDASVKKHNLRAAHLPFSKTVNVSSNGQQRNSSIHEHKMELDSGRKRSRSPVRIVQSTLGMLSMSKSPLRKFAKVVDSESQSKNNNAPTGTIKMKEAAGLHDNNSNNTAPEGATKKAISPRDAPVADTAHDNSNKSLPHHQKETDVDQMSKPDQPIVESTQQVNRTRKLLAEPPVKFSASSNRNAHPSPSLLTVESMEARKANMADKMRAKVCSIVCNPVSRSLSRSA